MRFSANTFTWVILGILANSVSGTFMHCPGFEAERNTKLDNPKLEFSTIKSLLKSTVHETEIGILINRTKVFKVHLDCWASYPIDLSFTGHVTNQHSEVRTKVNSYTKEDGVTGHCYHINVSMDTHEEITGNYSCFAVSNSTRITSKYIFVYSTPPGVLLKRGQNLTIVVNPEDKSVILPCAASDPSIQVQLHKLNGNGQQHSVVPSESLKFDPKKGFVMSFADSPEDQLGNYQCETAIVESDVLNIKLVSPTFKDWRVEPNLKMLMLKQGDRLNLTCMAKDEIFIETNPELLTVGESISQKARKSFGGEIPPHYKSVSNVFTKVLNETIVSGSAKCIRKSDNFTLHTWKFTVSNMTRKMGVLDTSFIANCPKPGTKKRPTLIMYECNNWVECSMSRCAGIDDACQSNPICTKSAWDCVPHGIIQCENPTGNGVLSQIYFTGFNKTRYTNWKYAPTEELLRLRMDESSSNGKSKPTKLMCEGTNFVFSAGFQWSLMLKNGFVMNLMDKIMIMETWGHSKSTIVSTLSFPLEIGIVRKAKNSCKATDSREQTAMIICSAPVWNSTEWINQTMRVNIPLDFYDNLTKLTSKIEPEVKSSSTAPAAIPCSFIATILFLQLCFRMFRIYK